MTSHEIREAIRKRFIDKSRYAVIEEVGISTGVGVRRIDIVVCDCYQSNSFRVDGIEIKISKADLRRELSDPEKHAVFFDSIDFYTLACPKEAIEGMKELIPPKWGILIVGENGTTRYARKPVALRDYIQKTVPRGFFASAVRQILQVQPSEIAIREAYERGKKERDEYYEKSRQWQSDYVRKNYDRLQKLNDIENRFAMWGEGTEMLDEFEAFRKIPTWKILNSIKSLRESLNNMEQYFSSQKETKDD